MKMSVTRALVELKRLNEKINQSYNIPFIAVQIGKDNNAKIENSTVTVQGVASELLSNFQSIDAAIKNRQKIKAAVVKSNAETKVMFAGTEMTVAEAIEMKASLPYKQGFLSALQRQYAAAINRTNSLNVKLNEDVDKALAVVYGNEKNKVDKDSYDQVAIPQQRQKEASVFDPCKVSDKIAALNTEVQNITAELDFVLAEINAKTEIEVDL